MLTDGCMWEINKQMGNEHPHAVEVVDLETGAVRYIKSGSKITFVEGEITDIRTQEAYNKATQKKVPSDKQDLQRRTRGKTKGKRNKSANKTKGV